LHGKDRTGMAIASWRIIYDKWSFEDAVKEMEKHGFHNFSYFFWKRKLKRLL